jgi:hypothetical protein
VEVGFVHDLEHAGMEGVGQLLAHRIGHRHRSIGGVASVDVKDFPSLSVPSPLPILN